MLFQLNRYSTMKKIVFGLMLVFATSSLVSANTIDNNADSCDEYAMAVFYEAVENGMNHFKAFQLSEDAYEICKGLHYIAENL